MPRAVSRNPRTAHASLRPQWRGMLSCAAFSRPDRPRH